MALEAVRIADVAVEALRTFVNKAGVFLNPKYAELKEELIKIIELIKEWLGIEKEGTEAARMKKGPGAPKQPHEEIDHWADGRKNHPGDGIVPKQVARSIGNINKGKWIPENIKGWSQEAIEYQEHVTGVRAGSTFEIEDVNFDGVKGDTLIETKSNYDQFVDKVTGEFQPWFKGAPDLLDQAKRQIVAANGAHLEWHFKTQRMLDATKKYFESNGITSGISYIFNPFK